MSAKKKKPHSSWLQCDTCRVTFLEKDSVLHSTNCAAFRTNHDVSYIYQDTLYCLAGIFSKNDESLKHVEEEETTNFVLLSQAALQLSRISIGDYVLVATHDNEKFVRRAWKGSDRIQLSAAFSQSDIILESTANKQVKVCKLQQPILTCREITVTCDNLNFNLKTLSRMQQANAHKIYFVGSKFKVFEYGKWTAYRISGIIPHDSNACRSGVFYKALPDTVWKWELTDEEKYRIQPCLNVGGAFSLIDELEETLNILVNKKPPFSDVLSTHGILLHGPHGSGKSLIMNFVASKWSNAPYPFRHFSLKSLTGQIEKDLTDLFMQAEAGAPSILTIDDLDVICCNSRSKNIERQFNTVLTAIFDRIQILKNKQILVLATCNDLNKIEKSLRRPGRFDKELEICVPNPKERLSILQVLLQEIPHSLESSDLKVVADSAHGFVGADLAALVSIAALLSFRMGESRLSPHNVLKSLSSVQPSALREITIQVPNVKWEDIGGQDQLKHKLRQAVEWPLKYNDSFIRLGISPPRGVLMFGPPGCSKTMIAKALATESGLNFISVKGPELFSKWVGESEKAVREVFRKARQSAPCIIFFDELDALAGERTSNSGGAQVQERVLAQLLTELDGVEALGHVIVVGATNRPDRIDPALLRPGRLDRVIYVPLPDYQTRFDIFAVQFRKTPVSTSVSIDELARLTDGYSGAEVVAVCHEAALNALELNMEAEIVTPGNFLSALRLITPRTPKSAIEVCEKYMEGSLNKAS